MTVGISIPRPCGPLACEHCYVPIALNNVRRWLQSFNAETQQAAGALGELINR